MRAPLTISKIDSPGAPPSLIPGGARNGENRSEQRVSGQILGADHLLVQRILNTITPWVNRPNARSGHSQPYSVVPECAESAALGSPDAPPVIMIGGGAR